MAKNKTPAWLNDAVFYEIYPQSFADSNGDGIGDIPGIIGRLDYIRSLGCNAIWVNPCFVSPFKDAGYDISDYYKVAPRYGTNADLKRLFAQAAKRGMRVCLDLVPGHTSVEHPWFAQSARPEASKYSNWYIWTDNWWDNTGPMQGISGQSDRNGKYITNFFYFQPALNYGFARPDPKCPWQLPVDHPDVQAVRAEMRKIMRFWLDMGASGFRVDMASSLVRNDPDKKQITRFWRETRAALAKDHPDMVLISEWGYPPAAIDAGFHIDFMLPFIPENRSLFSGPEYRGVVDYSGAYFSRAGKGDISVYMDRYMEFYRKIGGKGFASIVSGNHDIERLNYGRSTDDLEIIFAFLLTMPGVPFIYYGDEIGMRQIQPMRSKEGGYNRTSARTPMQWSRGRNAGFSTAPKGKLYLPVDPGADRPTVEAQEHDVDSLLNRVRALVRLRREHPALCASGDFAPLYVKKQAYPFVYQRSAGNRRIIVAMNPSGKAVHVEVPAKVRSVELLRGRGVQATPAKANLALKMAGCSYAILAVR